MCVCVGGGIEQDAIWTRASCLTAALMQHRNHLVTCPFYFYFFYLLVVWWDYKSTKKFVSKVDRTPDLAIFSRTLSQLSYRDTKIYFYVLFVCVWDAIAGNRTPVYSLATSRLSHWTTNALLCFCFSCLFCLVEGQTSHSDRYWYGVSGVSGVQLIFNHVLWRYGYGYTHTT